MNLARFRFSILRCICLEEPFQHVHLLTTRGKSLTADKQYILGTRPHILLCTAMCFSCHQTFSLQTMGKIGIEPIMFTTRERFYRPPQHRQSLPLSHNPDSRVSKVFFRVMPATIRLLRKVLPVLLPVSQGGVTSLPLLVNGCAGNCIRFSTSRPLKACFCLRTHPEKGGNNEKRK